MKNAETPTISSLAALKQRHLANFHEKGITERAIKLLGEILTDWVYDKGVAAAVFRRDHSQDLELLRSLESWQYISSEAQMPYVPRFDAFCAALAARKLIASSLLKEIEQIIARALALWNLDPLRTQIPLDEFKAPFGKSAFTLPALRLLGTASIGVHLSSVGGEELVQFSEVTRKARKPLEYVSSYLDMIFLPTPSPAWSQQSEKELNTFSIKNLELAKDAHKNAERALAQWISAPDTAISSAKSALESTLKYIAHTEGIVVESAVTLPNLLKYCKPYCGLGSDPSHHMSRAVASLCTEIAAARNLLGDSHGKSPNAVAPTRQEARFIVGVALHLSECLLERYEAHCTTKGSRAPQSKAN